MQPKTSGRGISTDVGIHGGVATHDSGATTRQVGASKRHGGETTRYGGVTTRHGGVATRHGGVTPRHGGVPTRHGGVTTRHGGVTTLHGGETTHDGGASTGYAFYHAPSRGDADIGGRCAKNHSLSTLGSPGQLASRCYDHGQDGDSMNGRANHGGSTPLWQLVQQEKKRHMPQRHLVAGLSSKQHSYLARMLLVWLFFCQSTPIDSLIAHLHSSAHPTMHHSTATQWIQITNYIEEDEFVRPPNRKGPQVLERKRESGIHTTTVFSRYKWDGSTKSEGSIFPIGRITDLAHEEEERPHSVWVFLGDGNLIAWPKPLVAIGLILNGNLIADFSPS